MEECPNGPCAVRFGPCVADTDCIGKKHACKKILRPNSPGT